MNKALWIARIWLLAIAGRVVFLYSREVLAEIGYCGGFVAVLQSNEARSFLWLIAFLGVTSWALLKVSEA
jgi:hypothetical protein